MSNPRVPGGSAGSEAEHDKESGSAEDASSELHQVRVDMASVRLLDESEDDVPEASAPPSSSVSVGARTSQVDLGWDEGGPVAEELPVLGPEHEVSDEIPVLGPEHEVGGGAASTPLPSARILGPVGVVIEDIPVLEPEPGDEIPVLGPEHEVSADEVDGAIPSARILGPVGVVIEDIPVLEPEVSDEIPVLGPEHEVSDEIPVLGPEHEVSDAIPVLGPEHEVSESEEPAEPFDEKVSALLSKYVGSDDEPLELGTDDDASGSAGEPLDDGAVPVDDARRKPDAGHSDAERDAEPLDVEPDADQPDADPLEAEPDADQPDAETDAESRNYRQIYETEFRDMERDARVAAAHTVEGSRLFALCLDADPQVINAIFQNARAGLEHARMAAAHHKNPVGLEFIVKRAEFARDIQVQRALLRNNQMSESLMRRVLGAKPMRDVYKVCIDREIPERNRVWSRGILRTRFAQSQSEDRASLVLATEGRCLAFLVGQTFDARTTSILCGKQYNSVLFIQNLARFPACPPPLLVHLLKQPFVRRHAALKKMILQHPNLPSQAKRNL